MPVILGEEIEFLVKYKNTTKISVLGRTALKVLVKLSFRELKIYNVARGSGAIVDSHDVEFFISTIILG